MKAAAGRNRSGRSFDRPDAETRKAVVTSTQFVTQLSVRQDKVERIFLFSVASKPNELTAFCRSDAIASALYNNEYWSVCVSDKHSKSFTDAKAEEAQPSTRPHRLAYTVAQLSRATGLEKTSIWMAIKSGELSSTLVGGRRLILHSDACAWLTLGEANDWIHS
jgi:hypothetical protein